uniref:Uncharacterized protein n=1 Tax=Arundo donax TaxID=35708 RepID=A0A0A9CNU5_ARUDO
MGSKNPRELAW